MNTSSPKASEIEAMTFIFTASAPAAAGGPRRWTRLLRWAREKARQYRRRESVAAVREPATRGTR